MRRYLGEQGVIPIIIKTIENYEDDPVLQLHSCTTLTNLFHNSLENRSRYVCNNNIITIEIGRVEVTIYYYYNKYNI